MYAVAAPFLLALGLSLALVPLCRLLATRAGRVAHPRADRWHRRPVALLGGVAIGTSLFVGAGVFGLVGEIPVLLACAVLMFATGLVDDLIHLKPATKLIVQITLASALLFFDYRLNWVESITLDSLLTLMWVVGMTNAFNLLDNMDGLCAGVAFVAGLVLLINAWSLDEIFISLILVAFMGSLFGFLLFNVQPARIFLGDCGSLFIGYLMGSLTLLERYVTHASGLLFPVLMPVLVLAVPLIDTATVMFIRVREGRPVYIGDNRHLSHRLVLLGFPRRRAVSILYLLTFSLGLGAAALTDATLFQSVLVLVQTAGFVTVVLMLMFVERPAAPPDRPPA